jgi:serine/threonine-protein kinase
VNVLLDKKPEARPSAIALVEQLAPTPDAAGQEPQTSRVSKRLALWKQLSGGAAQAWQRWAPALEQRLHAVGLKVPLEVLLLVAFGSILAGVLLVVLLMPDRDEPQATATQNGSVAVKPATRSAPVVKLADMPAETKAEVERISGLPVYKRRFDDWLALARATSQMGEYKESVLAYQAVLSLKASMRDDAQLLRDLSTAAKDPDSFSLVVNLCATRLKQRGVDLLWLLWQDFRRDPERADQAELLLKKLTVLSRRASKQLRSAIELETGSSCSKLEKAVARATKYSDERAVERLEALTKRDGCGPGGAHDCYPCLRRDDSLDNALEHAKSRKAPVYLR